MLVSGMSVDIGSVEVTNDYMALVILNLVFVAGLKFEMKKMAD